MNMQRTVIVYRIRDYPETCYLLWMYYLESLGRERILLRKKIR